jgi:hypothetical protein
VIEPEAVALATYGAPDRADRMLRWRSARSAPGGSRSSLGLLGHAGELLKVLTASGHEKFLAGANNTEITESETGRGANPQAP